MDKSSVQDIDLLVITGPTASGKTRLGALVAHRLDGEVISADSRQVYKGMDIGSGKDLQDFIVEGQPVPYHLIDIREPGYRYNVYEYQQDFLTAYEDIRSRGGVPVMVGGTGLYIEAVLKGYRLIRVPVDTAFRATLERKSMEELTVMLASYKKLHNTTDIDTPKRAIRALEIEHYYATHPEETGGFPEIRARVFGILVDRDTRRNNISRRLRQRLKEGMIEEVERLAAQGLSWEELEYYGLEYKYIAFYLQDQLSYDEMVHRLETAIHQFAKRQMTWFRGMERRGIPVTWIDGSLPEEEKVQVILEEYSQEG
jgi:tRNA dimethylallyltransferase